MKSENPLPAPGGIVYCLGAWPGARPARQRPRCNLLGALRFARCCGREWRGRAGGGAGGPSAGQTTPHGRGAPRSRRHRRSLPPRAETRPEEGLSAPGCTPRFPSLPHPHPPRPKRKEDVGGGQREATPPAGGSVRAPGGRDRRAEGGGRAERGPAEAAACVVLFLDSFQLLGKETFVSRYKKRGGGGKGVGKKTVKHRLERLFAK